jgi:hypothetical protein
MNSEDLTDLVRRAEVEREVLADAIGDVRDEIDRRRREWRFAGLAAGALVGAGTMAYKLFGKASLASRFNRAGSFASVLLGLTRAAIRLRRFF